MFKLARINGSSLGPKLLDGTFAVFRRRDKVKRGDVVLLNHPEYGWVIKKVHAVGRTGTISLHGLSDLSAGTQRPGPVASEHLYGRLLFKVPLIRWRSSSALADSAEPAE